MQNLFEFTLYFYEISPPMAMNLICKKLNLLKIFKVKYHNIALRPVVH